MRTRLCSALLPLLATSTLLPGDAGQSLQALRTQEGIRVDGRLDEGAWSQAQTSGPFTVSWPELGKPSAFPTEVKVLYDDHYVYVGARMRSADGRSSVVQQVHRRDQDSASDWFGVYLDSLHDRRTAFAFFVNAAGVQQDRVCFADTNQDQSWDGVWESAVSVDEQGWTAELKIPLSLLRLKDTHDGQTWGINFERTAMLPAQEISQWRVVPRGVNAFVSNFPELTGIEGVKPQPRRDWVPYLSTQRKFSTAQDFDDRKWTNRAGLDAHLGINSYSQLDLSVKPDFGQVEVDQAVLNLTTFETFFQEKRPFFLEGMEIFDVNGPQLFYSRRIGKGLYPPYVAEGTLVDAPTAAEILGAAKYTAKFSGGTNLGVLAANLQPARATIRLDSGEEFEREVYPMTNAAVVRATQAMDSHGSFLGGFLSYFHQAEATGRQAFVGALDGTFRSADRASLLEFSLAHSEAGPRDQERQGSWQQVHLGQRWKSGWGADLFMLNTTRYFNPNDLGYLARADQQQVQFVLDRRWDKPLGFLQNRRWNTTLSASRDQEGKVFERYVNSWFRSDFKNGWGAQLGAAYSFPVEDDRELRTFMRPVKSYLHYESHPWFWINVNTPGNYWWSLAYTNLWDIYSGGPSYRHILTHSIRPVPNLDIQVSTLFERHEGEPHFLPDPGAAAPLVGFRRLSELDQTLRISYAFNPRFTLQLFSQWMEDAWSYRDLKTWRGSDILVPGAKPSDPAYLSATERLWNLNLIARWEFRPGSSAYLVYTHGVYSPEFLNDQASIRPVVDLAQLRHLPSDDVVQLKLSWLFR